MRGRKNEPIVSTSKRAPALTTQQREAQIVSAAMDLAEKQIREGTASSQVLTHYLKLGSSREQLEQIGIDQNNKLMKAKQEMLESQQRIEELYGEALKAMSKYQGNDDSEEEPIEDDYAF